MNKGRSNNSLWEKMVANIVKLSSLSVAKMSLRTAGPPPATKKIASLTGIVKLDDDPPQPKFPVNQRSQEPQSSSKPVSYLIEPIEGNGSLYVIHEEESVDERATDYIRKIQDRNRHDSNETSIPPPPRVAI